MASKQVKKVQVKYVNKRGLAQSLKSRSGWKKWRGETGAEKLAAFVEYRQGIVDQKPDKDFVHLHVVSTVTYKWSLGMKPLQLNFGRGGTRDVCWFSRLQVEFNALLGAVVGAELNIFCLNALWYHGASY